jgi:O-antigen/teichoic acid export membrane protein
MELTALELEKVSKFVNKYKNNEDRRLSFQPLMFSLFGLILFIVSIVYTMNNLNAKTMEWLFLPASLFSMLFIFGGLFMMKSNKKESEIISIAKIIGKELK